jgi:lipopolysaccharide transport system ATP-binding protein
MTDVAIRVDGLGKQYRIGAQSARYRTFRDTLNDIFTTPFRRAARLLRGQAYGAADLTETIWALRDVSFEIKRGESVGFIGHNGAGKSTLLKILSRITEPTEGCADVYGRVGALLEVGTGFHPELTGRENIFLNAAILGMNRREIEAKFDEIVEFAEIERFIDTPVKHYSSGMTLRLGFAVAAHLEPEILIVDEVLAVGDARFQRKCMGKMDAVANQGRTVLFVSHNLAAVQALCQRVIWLHQGRIVKTGEPSEVISEYLGSAVETGSERIWSFEDAPGNDQVRVRRVAARPVDGTPDDVITTQTPVAIELEYWNLEPGLYLDPCLSIENDQGALLFNSHPAFEPNWHEKPFPKGLFRSICYLPAELLNSRVYRVRVLFFRDARLIIYNTGDLLEINVQHEHSERLIGFYRSEGMIHPPALDWTTELLHEGDPESDEQGVAKGGVTR